MSWPKVSQHRIQELDKLTQSGTGTFSPFPNLWTFSPWSFSLIVTDILKRSFVWIVIPVRTLEFGIAALNATGTLAMTKPNRLKLQ